MSTTRHLETCTQSYRPRTSKTSSRKRVNSGRLNRVEIWEHDGKLFEYNSMYCLPEDAWHHELTGLSAPASVSLVIPDVTPDGPFTPAPASNAMLRFYDGAIPWPIWTKFMNTVQDTGDLAEG